MGEAVHLRVPMLSVPLGGQYEQELNARYLQKLGYGSFSHSLDVDSMATFLKNTDAHAHALQNYVPQDNSMLLRLVDELVGDVSVDAPAPEKLRAPAMATYEGPVHVDEDE